MNPLLRTALALVTVVAAGPLAAQITFYEHDDFAGRTFTAEQSVDNFRSFGFNDRASSVVVVGRRWQLCDDAYFGGRCVELRPGRYSSLSAMGMNDRVSSVRAITYDGRADDRSAEEVRQEHRREYERRYPVTAQPDPRYQRRDNERLFQANVTAVRAVVGQAEQRCWIEHTQVQQEPERRSNVPGTVVGALLGGIIGHQIGGGTGRDIATIGGAVAGGAIGNRVGRDNNSGQMVNKDVQRCREVPSTANPAYWDVSYTFRGRDHKVQMTSAPGATISVNRDGEPRF